MEFCHIIRSRLSTTRLSQVCPTAISIYPPRPPETYLPQFRTQTLSIRQPKHCAHTIEGFNPINITISIVGVKLISLPIIGKHGHATANPIDAIRASQGPRSVSSSFFGEPNRRRPIAPPSLDSTSSQTGRTWPQLAPPRSQVAAKAQTTLPTPLNRYSELSRPEGQSVDKFANLAAVASNTPLAMGTALDALNAPQSLTARRQAASNLPAFELPPPPLSQYTANVAQKYSSYPSSNAQQQASSAVSVGNLLTPPSNSNSDSTSPTGGINHNNNQNNPGILPYTPNIYWPSGTGTTPYNTGFTPTWQGSNAFFPTRGMFSPSLGSLVRNSNNSPAASESQSLPPPPPYDINVLPPFQSSMSMSAPPNSAVALDQQQQQQQQAMSNVMLSSQNGMPSTSQSPSVNSSEAMSQKSASAPALYGGSQPSSTPQQSSFPYGGPSSLQQSPHLASSASTSRISPPIGQSPVNNTLPQAHFVRPPYPSYSLPAMQGAILTNVHSPGSQMSMVGNMQHGMMPQFNSGYAANAQNMYNNSNHNNNQQHQNQQQAVPNDRPFKCDQCPQSFNRNHDLKRHKRIHLAVKPFPCNHCDKSFSRKDALKV